MHPWWNCKGENKIKIMPNFQLHFKRKLGIICMSRGGQPLWPISMEAILCFSPQMWIATPIWMRIWHLAYNNIHWKVSRGLSQWETHDISTPPISHSKLSSTRFLQWSENHISISHKRNGITFTSRAFITMNVNCTWSNHWHHPNA
jgi:hypothetical protein